MPQQCSQCSGTGMVQTSFGPKPCPNCAGKGYLYEESTSTDDSIDSIVSSWSFWDWFAVILFIVAMLYGILKSG